MVFTVQGYIGQVSYAVEVGHADDGAAGYKITAGSAAALAVLRAHDGEDVEVTPVGPTVTGDAGTPDGVLALLTAHTEITDVEGDDVPDLLGPAPHGHVH